MGKINKDLETGKTLLKDQVEIVGILEEGFIGLGEKISNAFSNMQDSLEGNLDLSEKLAKSLERNITGSIKKMGNGLEDNIKLQIRINKGQNVSNDIQKAREKLDIQNIQTKRRINKLFGEGSDIAKDILGRMHDIVETEKDELDILEELNTENQKSISIYKIAGDALGDMANKIDKSGTLAGVLSGKMGEVVTVARLGQLAAIDFVTSFIKGIGTINEQTVAIQKSMGLSGREAAAFRREMANAALETGTTAVNSNDTLKTIGELNAQFGTASRLLGKQGIVGEMALLAKTTGLSAESQASFAAFTLKAGMHASEVTRQARRAVVAAENEFGVRLNINKTLDEAGQITGVIRANLGFNIIAISGAIAKAKQFGMTLQDLAGISANLLNFQSSIEAELTAELFTGKQLNLERARLFALTGDYKGLTEEIKANAGGELEFARMNVLQKEKLAAALGMQADQMSDMVFKQANLAELAEQARNIGDNDLADSLTKRDIQQQFNDLILKAQTILVDMAAGPLGHLAEGFANLLNNAKLLKGLLIALAAVKMAGLVSGMISLGTAIGLTGAGAAFTIGALTLGAGLLIAGPIIAGYMASMEKAKKTAATVSYASLPSGQRVDLKNGEGKFHSGESVVHTEDLDTILKQNNSKFQNNNKGGITSQTFSMAIVEDILGKILNATTYNKPYKPLAKWETSTLYR